MNGKAYRNKSNYGIINAIDKGRMGEHLKVFCQLNRLTGEKGCRSSSQLYH
ncbi:hypothetical protein [Pseudalkalibacillus decolorationis]|uniref:hypothetical protein n=1 Tax=Pseudalkalibacillus decolorationis TaxID=163879 RepID=UPI002148451F|nr:hypothetical protein [Pseudalkalibacillus decolorationis]